MTDSQIRIDDAWQVLDHVVEAVSVVGPDGRHLYINAASQAILDDLRERYEQGPIAELAWGAVAPDGTPVPNERLPVEITRMTGEELDGVDLGFPDRRGDLRWLRISTRRFGTAGPPYCVVASYRDVTGVRATEQRLRATVDTLLEGVVFCNADGRTEMMNSAAEEILGVTRAEWSDAQRDPAREVRDVHGRELSRDDWPLHRARVAGEHVTGVLLALDQPGDERRWVEVNARPVKTASLAGPWPAVASFRDVTAQRQEEEARKAAEEGFRQAFDHAPNGMMVEALDGTILQANPAMAALTGYEVSELEGRHVTELVHPDQRAAVRETIAMVGGGDASVARSDRCWRRADGCDIWVSVSSTILHDAAGAPRRILVQVVDITDRHRVEEELQHLAEHDPLTGLANRRNFEQALSLHRAAPDRAGEGAVVMLDLDGFKPINDTYGHRTGDRLLVGIARAVRRQLRHRDCIARLGGDEFAVLLTDADRAAAELVAKKLVGAVPRAGRSVLPAGAPRVTVSIGIALLSEGPADPDDILAAADRAMYAAKHGGRNQVAFAQWSGRWT